MLGRRYQVALLITLVLAVFYPGISGEFCSSDDLVMVSSLLNMNDWSMKDLFVPKLGGGLYYRPLLYLTFIFDRFGWFLSSSFMHLENILFHLTNTLLVYFLTLELLADDNKDTSLLPLIAALCFGLHPITTEPANWISGRTDLMAGAFVLASALCLVRYKSCLKKRYLIGALVTFLMGMLCKEVALAFLPGACLILLSRKDHLSSVSADAKSFNLKKLITRLLVLCIFTGAVFAFIFLRSLAFTNNSSKISRTLQFFFNDPDYSLLVCFRTFGFYVKKIFYPFPLNFTIIDIDPLYEILAVPVLLLAIYAAFRRSRVSAIFLSGVFLITPAFIIAFNQIAWTPYAERYIYIATAFVVIATVISIAPLLNRITTRTSITVGILCLLTIVTVATFRRNIIWQSNVELFKDTVEKSPGFNKAWNEYGVALAKKGDLEGAKSKFIKAASLYSFEYDDVSRMNLASLQLIQGNEEAAIKGCMKVIEESKGKSPSAFNFLISYYQEKLRKAKTVDESRELTYKMIEYNDKLYTLTGKTFILYNSGRLLLAVGEKRKALEYFRKAYNAFPDSDEYKGHAKKFVTRLENE